MLGLDEDIEDNFTEEEWNNYYLSNTSDEEENLKPEEKKSVFSVAVEGNIGSGKTTVLNYFKRFSNVDVLVEPVEKWKNIKGFNSLDLMYKDATRWSAAFQSYVTLTMLHNHNSLKDEKTVRMMERSVYSARYCFIENLHQGNLMPDMDYSMLCEWHDWIKTNAEAKLDLIVYLNASPETCLKRISVRNRHEETGVSLDYLKTLHRLHEGWLMKKSYGELPAKVLVINTECNKEEVIQQLEEYQSFIMCGISPILH